MGKLKSLRKNDAKQQLLLGIKKDEAEIKLYQKLLNIKRKKKGFLSNLFSTMDAEFSDVDEKSDQEEDGNEEQNSSDGDECTDNSENVDEEIEESQNSDEDMKNFENCDEDMGDLERCEEIEESEEEVENISDADIDISPVKTGKASNKVKADEQISELHSKIKRNMLQHLNKLCESQMMKCLDSVEEIWNSFPRGDVRDVFIKESVAYMKFSCLDLASFVVSLHIRLSKHTNLVAFYIEYIVEKLTAYKQTNWENEAAFCTIMSIFKFIAYITRLETIDCNLILDLMTEILSTFALPQLKVIAEVSSIIGFYIRKNSSARCEAFVKLVREKMLENLNGTSDMNEMKSYAEGTVTKLTNSKAKSDVAYAEVEKYKKFMKKWSRNLTLSETIALKLSDFRGENRVRWWLVGSAVDPNVAHNKSAAVTCTKALMSPKFSDKEKEWNDIGKSLGFTTDGKQELFRMLMKGKAKEDQDDINDTMEGIFRLTKSSGGVIAISEGDMVRAIIRCLTLDTEFCQFYVNVLAALLENHRRFRQIVKCAFWDVLAQPKLVQSARSNCGRCVGQLIAMAGLPVNCLKKFSFIDASVANTAFMVSVMTEIFEENWDDIAEHMKEMLATISIKFIGNLRIFLKRNFDITDNPDQWSRATIFKVTKCIETLTALRRGTV